MCGIAGWIDWKVDLTQQGPLIARMGETLSHRGPDTQDHWLAPHAALAHRRLIVLDPGGGGQPMVYQDGARRYAITYNGEIYNFRELRRELEGFGHTFRTRSDTEVILHAYARWGEACVGRLNGIFAFGLWDEQEHHLLLARDHLGVKPLFYAVRGSALLFGSELKVLLAHPLVRAEVDAGGLAEILTFVRIPGSGVYRQVQELRPGHLAIWNERGLRISRYWSPHSAPHTEDMPTTAEHIRALLEDTVIRQLVADVPVATLLSGGLDSSGITALAARAFQQEGKRLHTYSVDFVGSAERFQSTIIHPSLDAPWVKRVSEDAGTAHHTITCDTPTLVENLLVPVHAYDLPAIGQMMTSLYLLFQAIKQEATVALSGESADEFFGGYHWFHRDVDLNTPTFPWLFAFLGPGENPLSWVSAELVRQVQPTEHIQQQYRQALAEVPRLEGEGARAARIRELFYLTLTSFLPIMLDRKDRMSMATGLEVRVPFCDYRLVEYVWNVPLEMKAVDGMEKGILRRALMKVLPEDVRLRKKSAYPSAHDPAYDEATREWARTILNDANAPIQPLLDRRVVQAAMDNSEAPPATTLVSLWERIIQMNEWLKTYQVSLAL